MSLAAWEAALDRAEERRLAAGDAERLPMWLEVPRDVWDAANDAGEDHEGPATPVVLGAYLREAQGDADYYDTIVDIGHAHDVYETCAPWGKHVYDYDRRAKRWHTEGYCDECS